jgi:hypothetical protein
MKKAIAIGALAASLYAVEPALPQDSNEIPPIPEGRYLMSVKPTPISVVHEYDRDGNGVGDYKTVRMIKSISPWGMNLTMPLFYYIDMNKNFLYDKDEIFVDDALDGISGNEEVYKEPKQYEGQTKEDLRT